MNVRQDIRPVACLPLVVASFYKFAKLESPAQVCNDLRAFLSDCGATGTILIAAEGINASLAGVPEALELSIAAIEDRIGAGIERLNVTGAAESPFRRLEIRLRDEIVTLRHEQPVKVEAAGGQYVSPEQWNDLLDDPRVLVVDVRNSYEIRLGRFTGAHDPGTDAFQEFPERMAGLLADQPAEAVAMYCTGGIRCEKAAVWLRDHGVEQVYQLEGGILAYLANAPDDSRWDGDCFVFDKRISVGAALVPGNCTQCHNCRNPLTPEDRATADYEFGVSCPYCRASLDENEKQVLRQRAHFLSHGENS